MEDPLTPLFRGISIAEEKLSKECPVDINAINAYYIRDMLVAPMLLAIPIGILWCFIPGAKWGYYFALIAIIAIIHSAEFIRPAQWRIRSTKCPLWNTTKAQCLYDVAMWKEYNPFKYIQLISSLDAFEREYLLSGDMMLKAALLQHPDAMIEVAVKKDAGGYANVTDNPFDLALDAATLGSTKAQATIGCWYLNGHRTDVNHIEALKWLEKAAKRGNSDALCDLGEMYFHGKGVSADRKKAVKLLRKSADSGHTYAQQKVGIILFSGAKSKEEQMDGLKYIVQASNAGHVKSKIFIATLAITTPMKLTPVEGYATLLYLSRSSDDARQVAESLGHKFTDAEKAEARKMADSIS